MSQVELDRLEKDVETARQRVGEDLARLRSPTTLSSFKDGIQSEVRACRDGLVDKTTNAVKDRAQGLLTEIKERAAANPLAALAVGAGLMWRLLRKPPVATLLVGGGLVSLLRTDPQHPRIGADLVPQARDLAIAARDKAEELGADAKDIYAAARTKMDEWTDTAGDAIVQASVALEPATETLQQWGADARAAASELSTVAKSLLDHGSETTHRIVQDPEERDKFLLGAATMALIAAVGIASQRHSSDPLARGDGYPPNG